VKPNAKEGKVWYTNKISCEKLS